jgi:frataxin-like iron-binding protein CyaY
MDETAFLEAADATLGRIGLALDAALETSNASFQWTLADGVLTIDNDGAHIVVRRDVVARAIHVDAADTTVSFQRREERWEDEREQELRDTLVRMLKSEVRIAVRMPDLPARP